MADGTQIFNLQTAINSAMHGLLDFVEIVYVGAVIWVCGVAK